MPDGRCCILIMRLIPGKWGQIQAVSNIRCTSLKLQYRDFIFFSFSFSFISSPFSRVSSSYFQPSKKNKKQLSVSFSYSWCCFHSQCVKQESVMSVKSQSTVIWEILQGLYRGHLPVCPSMCALSGLLFFHKSNKQECIQQYYTFKVQFVTSCHLGDQIFWLPCSFTHSLTHSFPSFAVNWVNSHIKKHVEFSF